MTRHGTRGFVTETCDECGRRRADDQPCRCERAAEVACYGVTALARLIRAAQRGA